MSGFIIGLFVPFLFFSAVSDQYSIIQSQHYEMYKYLRYKTKMKVAIIMGQLFLIVINCFFYMINWMLVIFSILINIFLLEKSKIKYTKRVKRYFCIYYVFTFVFYMVLPLSNLNKLFFVSTMLVLIICVCHFLSCFVEMNIMNVFVFLAKRKIKGKKIIGITGSYGKTSSKNIIYDMMECLCNVSKSPKSYNTKVGIVKSIRENVNEFDEYFICEYGVDRKGGMNRLLKIVNPNIAVITEIGPQHLLTFKNIKNIINEKIKLVKALKKYEYAIINNDNKYLREIKKELQCKLITYGIKNNSDIMAKNIEVSTRGSEFDLYVNDKYIDRISISLLGMHNVLNTLGAIGVLKSLNTDLSVIKKISKNIKPVEHRLELKHMDGYKIIDDSFNANEVGFKNAIDILSFMKEEKIVITPGIIEQGKNSEKTNYELGRYMANKVDEVILVDKNASAIKRGLLEEGFDSKKITLNKNFLEAWDLLKKRKDKENKIILIENDVPCIYLK